jgi:hypothetical protein
MISRSCRLGRRASWSVVEPGKQAQAQIAFGTYFIEIRPDNKSYVLRFTSEAGERVCPTRFTAN